MTNFNFFMIKMADFRCKFHFYPKITIINKISAEMRYFPRIKFENRVSWPTESFDFCRFQIRPHFTRKSTCESWGAKYEAKMTNPRLMWSQISVIFASAFARNLFKLNYTTHCDSLCVIEIQKIGIWKGLFGPFQLPPGKGPPRYRDSILYRYKYIEITLIFARDFLSDARRNYKITTVRNDLH